MSIISTVTVTVELLLGSPRSCATTIKVYTPFSSLSMGGMVVMTPVSELISNFPSSPPSIRNLTSELFVLGLSLSTADT